MEAGTAEALELVLAFGATFVVVILAAWRSRGRSVNVTSACDGIHIERVGRN